MTTIIVLVVGVALVLYMISIYNGLVVRKNRFRNAFSQIDVQLERRYDLIPNLVETAKAYMSHERETLEAVVKARNQAQAACRAANSNPTDAAAIGKLSQAEGVLSQALGRMMVLTESYPELKAQETMKSLMEELTNTENTVAFARQAYNDAVMSYNSAREQFPANIFAPGFGFSEAAFLKVDSEEKRAAPKVQFRQ
jgi:LemA protein